MPRPGCLVQDAADTAGEIGRAIVSHLGLEADQIDSFYPERNRKGLFIALKSGTVEKRAMVLDADQYPKEKPDPVEELKLLLERIPAGDRSKVLDHLGLMERPRAQPDSGSAISSVFDLDSIFSKPEPVTYLIEPEIPAEAVVYLAGAPESGKSTLASAWARDLADKGHGVLLLDRDFNPRAVIRDRFERLGMSSDGPFWVWDSRQTSEPPQPDSPEVINWVKYVRLTTEKPPLVIVDSTVSFLPPGEDENSSQDVRALFNRCRAVVRAGGSVLLLHHLNKGGELRGSSDFGAAADQGFIVTNSPVGKHRLSRLSLKVAKTRYALDRNLEYDYADGKMVRVEVGRQPDVDRGASDASDEVTTTALTEVLRANPGIGSRQFEGKAHERGVPYNQARRFLEDGKKSRKILVESAGRKLRHFLSEQQHEQGQ